MAANAKNHQVTFKPLRRFSLPEAKQWRADQVSEESVHPFHIDLVIRPPGDQIHRSVNAAAQQRFPLGPLTDPSFKRRPRRELKASYTPQQAVQRTDPLGVSLGLSPKLLGIPSLLRPSGQASVEDQKRLAYEGVPSSRRCPSYPSELEAPESGERGGPQRGERGTAHSSCFSGLQVVLDAFRWFWIGPHSVGWCLQSFF